MNDLAQWQAQNEQYLAAALAWLRLRLKRLAGGTAENTPVLHTAPPSPPTGWWSRKRRATAEPASDSPAMTLSPVTEAQIAQATETMNAAAATEPPPALFILAHRLGLSRFEQEVLLLCAAMELDTRMAALCAFAQDDLHRPYPTFALALALFDDPAWEVLSPERPLRYWRLIEINQPSAQPLTTSALRADERMVNYLKGLNYLDDRLAPLLVPFEVVGGVELAPSQKTAVQLAVHHLQQGAAGGPPPVIQLVGIDSLSKQVVAQEAAGALGLHLNRLPVELLPNQPAELETMARLWQREMALLPVALYLDVQETDGPTMPEGQSPPLHRFLARSQGACFLATRDVRPGLGVVTTAVEVDKPTPGEQQAIWAETINSYQLSVNGEELSALLAGQFNLNGTTIRQIARMTLEEPANSSLSPDVASPLWQACLATTRPRLDVLAQRLDAKATWDDLILPPEEKGLLCHLAEQVQGRSLVYDEWGFRSKLNRGLGINALFGGESGTGKTMAAEVIANHLGLNLYRIDLSAVVSKYIGETEKNLRRLFDAAEDGGAILFFDEADALFGKRSEVRDSHDRYANIEINYLLQRMEAYHGLAILATNMKNALDQAFLRRLRFVINFPFPGPAQRKAIWQYIFPPQTPTAGLDFDRLARFNLTGGSINNIALNAAFLAVHAEARQVTMRLLLQAIQAEYRKLERPIHEAEFQYSVISRQSSVIGER